MPTIYIFYLKHRLKKIFLRTICFPPYVDKGLTNIQFSHLFIICAYLLCRQLGALLIMNILQQIKYALPYYC